MTEGYPMSILNDHIGKINTQNEALIKFVVNTSRATETETTVEQLAQEAAMLLTKLEAHND